MEIFVVQKIVPHFQRAIMFYAFQVKGLYIFSFIFSLLSRGFIHMFWLFMMNLLMWSNHSYGFLFSLMLSILFIILNPYEPVLADLPLIIFSSLNFPLSFGSRLIVYLKNKRIKACHEFYETLHIIIAQLYILQVNSFQHL